MGAFSPRGWRLVRLGGGTGAAPRSDRPGGPGGRARAARARPAGRAAPRPRALRRRGRRRARRRRSGDARAAAAARAARAGRDLGGRRDLRAQPPRAHRGERVLGRRLRARLRRRAPRAVPQGRRLPPHGRARRGGRRAQRVDAGRCRSPSSASCWTPTARSWRSRAATTSRRATSRPRTRSTCRRPSSSRPAARSARRCSCPTTPPRRYAISVRIWNADGALVNEDAHEHRRDAPQLRGARLLVRAREPRCPPARCCSRARASCRPTTSRWRRATASRSRWRASACSRTRARGRSQRSTGQAHRAFVRVHPPHFGVWPRTCDRVSAGCPAGRGRSGRAAPRPPRSRPSCPAPAAPSRPPACSPGARRRRRPGAAG